MPFYLPVDLLRDELKAQLPSVHARLVSERKLKCVRPEGNTGLFMCFNFHIKTFIFIISY